MRSTLKIRFALVTLARAPELCVQFGLKMAEALEPVDDNQQELFAEVTVYQDGVLGNSHLYREEFGMPLRVKLTLLRYGTTRAARDERCMAHLYSRDGKALALVSLGAGEQKRIEGKLEDVLTGLTQAMIETI